MKKLYAFSLSVFFFSLFSQAQITVTDADFANGGDTARMTVAVWNPLLDFGATGPNYVWDFSQLQWQSQYVDTFLQTYQVNPIYGFTFSNLSINPYRSNIAKKAENALTTIPLISTVFTEGYSFFYKSTSFYRQRGIGMKVAGFPTSTPFAHSDTMYRFPMNFGDEDSSWSDYKVSIPQLGGYAHIQHRVNQVDGWGVLTTPFGTFDVLRMRTEIRGSDSLYIDTLNFGFKYDNDIIREYKWFTNGQKEPLLQINTQAGILGQFQGFEFVTKIVYRDSIRFDPTGIFDVTKNEIHLQVFPNPSSGVFYVSVPDNLNKATLNLSDINGKLLISREMNSAYEVIDASVFAKGIYILSVQSTEGKAERKLVVQ